MELNWNSIRRIYVALYVIDLINTRLDEEKIIQIVRWDEKQRLDEICLITGRSFELENNIRETCLNRAIEFVRKDG